MKSIPFNLQIEKPVVFFDLETTGVDVSTAKIVEFSALKVYPDSSEEELSLLINPEIPIPEEASQINNITNEMVKDAKTFKEVSKQIFDFIGESDLGGFNITGYDISLLYKEFQEVGIDWVYSNKKFFDSFRIFLKKEPRNLTNAVKYYLDEDFEGSHRAAADTRASYEILKAQINKYSIESTASIIHSEVMSNFVDLAGKLKIINGEPSFTFGKYKNLPVKTVKALDFGYLMWVLKNPEFTSDFKQHLLKLSQE